MLFPAVRLKADEEELGLRSTGRHLVRILLMERFQDFELENDI